MPTPKEGINGTNNKAPWFLSLADTIKNDTVTMYGKTNQEVFKIKFALSDIDPKTEEVKKYNTHYYFTLPLLVSSTYKLDTTANRRLVVQKRDTQDWLSGYFSGTFITTVPAGSDAYFKDPFNINLNFTLKRHN
jgi:hypothetical protein